MSELPLTFGRILVRVVLSEPRLDPAPPVFQRVYEPGETLQQITHTAFQHFAPHLPTGDTRAVLCFENRRLAGFQTVDTGGHAVREGDSAYWMTTFRPIATECKTVGDWLNMRADDQTTLGTVQFELRCVASADVEARR